MNKSYNYPKAYEHIHWILCGLPDKYVKWDYKSKCFGYYYLLRAYEQWDDENINYLVSAVFSGKKPPHSSYYLMEIIKEDKRIDEERKKK